MRSALYGALDFFEQVVVLEDWGLHLVVAPSLKSWAISPESAVYAQDLGATNRYPVGHKPAEALHDNQSFVKFPTLYHKRSWKGKFCENAVRTHIYVFCAATALFWLPCIPTFLFLLHYVEHLGGAYPWQVWLWDYGLTQMLVRIPLGFASDRLGRHQALCHLGDSCHSKQQDWAWPGIPWPHWPSGEWRAWPLEPGWPSQYCLRATFRPMKRRGPWGSSHSSI